MLAPFHRIGHGARPLDKSGINAGSVAGRWRRLAERRNGRRSRYRRLCRLRRPSGFWIGGRRRSCGSGRHSRGCASFVFVMIGLGDSESGCERNAHDKPCGEAKKFLGHGDTFMVRAPCPCENDALHNCGRPERGDPPCLRVRDISALGAPSSWLASPQAVANMSAGSAMMLSAPASILRR